MRRDGASENYDRCMSVWLRLRRYFGRKCRCDEAKQSKFGSLRRKRFWHNGGLQPQLPLALAERAQPQCVKLDEARGVAVIVGDCAFLEGDEILIVERVLALAADHGGVALVELHPHLTGDILLAEIDRRLQHLALR